jgi:predicted DNA-binding transcriptional regulator AlpA
MDGYLTSEQLADRLGVRRGSIHRYRTRGDLPEPDEVIGRSPVWKVETIECWEAARPGHGWRRGKRRDANGNFT